MKMHFGIYFGIFFISVVTGSSLNGTCQNDEHCGTIDSYCNNGICDCIEHFLIHEDSCVEVLQPQITCTNNVDCQSLKERTICKQNKCSCIPFHHEHNNICIKNRGLHERCENDNQCYWGQSMESKMGCISGVCSCKPGYVPHNNRKCVSGATTQFLLSNVIILVSLVVFKLF